MFQFRRFPVYAYLIQRTLMRYCRTGFPHSEIRGSSLMCSSPRLIAACRVLHRLLMPRHSPCALLCLISAPAPSGAAIAVLELCRHSFRFFREIVIVTHTAAPCFHTAQQSSTISFAFCLFCCLAFASLCSVFKVQVRTGTAPHFIRVKPGWWR